MVGAGPNIRLLVNRTERIGVVGVRIILVQRTNAIAGDRVEGKGLRTQVYGPTGKESHTAAAEVLGGKHELSRQLVLDGQSPSFGIQVSSALPQQFARMRCSFWCPEPRKIGSGLLVGREQRAWVVNRNSVGIALKTGVQIVILSSSMVDAETSANDGLSVQPRRRPRQRDSRIKVLVVRVV